MLIGRRVERRAGIDFAAFDYERPSGEPAVPTLLFHGTADTQVPVISSDRFAEARPDLVTRVRMEGVEHTQEWNADPQGYERALTAFVQGIAEG